MDRETWWKNFSLLLELEASGMFIYNGIKAFHSLKALSNPIDIFEVQYNLSVGIERLLKVAVILLEHTDQTDSEAFEKSLISHNTMDLANRVNRHQDLQLSDIHREFLAILSKFYKTHRYGRFMVDSAPNIEEEKREFLEFARKHFDKSIDVESDYPIPNSSNLKKSLGKLLTKIVRSVYKVICAKTKELNIYSHEIRYGSKATKIFLGDRLDFIDEEQTKRELLLFLMHPTTGGSHVEMIREFQPIHLEAETSAFYIDTLLNDTPEALINALGEVEELYTDLTNIRERFENLSLMETEIFTFEDEADWESDEE